MIDYFDFIVDLVHILGHLLAFFNVLFNEDGRGSLDSESLG